MRRLAILLGVCALAVPAVAWAHATLRDESPGFQKTVAVSPRRIVLDFDQYVSFPSVQVYDSSGKTFAGKAVVNGLEISSILKGESVPVPPSLLSHYPQLKEISR